MNIIKHKYVFLTLSGILVLASVVALSVFGLKQGIDFVGGTQWEIGVQGISASGVDYQTLQEILPKDAVITAEGYQSFIIRLPELSEADHQKYLKLITEKDPVLVELSFESIGASIGSELRSKAIWAFLAVLIGISLYIAFAFRKVSRPVSSWKYGLITLLTLFHDAIIPAGLMAYLGWLSGADIGVNFIVAILVVMGFSVHDTIVVFDRIRENLRTSVSNADFGELVNKSINQTFARSVNTSLTLVLVLVILYFFGASSLGYFTLVMLVGTLVGTYSSIFVASPLLVLWQRK